MAANETNFPNDAALGNVIDQNNEEDMSSNSNSNKRIQAMYQSRLA